MESNRKRITKTLFTYSVLTTFFLMALLIRCRAVKTAYKSAEAVVGDLIIDTSIQRPMMEAAMVTGSTLQKELPIHYMRKLPIGLRKKQE